MNSIWFTADSHFHHAKILEFESEARPFKTVEEMNECLVEGWNSVVRNNDTVYHLGDFCFGKHNLSIAQQLNGKKRLVMGNHDSYPSRYYLLYFDKLYGVKFWEDCILSHVPVHIGGHGKRWWVNVHGHLHSKKIQTKSWNPDCCGDDPNYFNVSVEQNNLCPIHADQIRQRVKEVKGEV